MGLAWPKKMSLVKDTAMYRNSILGFLSTLKICSMIFALLILVLVDGTLAQSKIKTLHQFVGGNDGDFPSSALVFDGAGNLYGTASNGGRSGAGIVFELTPNTNGTWKEHIIHSFAGHDHNDGAGPEAALIFDGAGNLYGTTGEGGPMDFGTVFKMTPKGDGTWAESVLYSFCSFSKCADGSYPMGGLVFDQGGNLYGTTSMGGSNGMGAVFKLSVTRDGSWTESVLYSFCSLTNCSDGQEPYASLVFDTWGISTAPRSEEASHRVDWSLSSLQAGTEVGQRALFTTFTAPTEAPRQTLSSSMQKATCMARLREEVRRVLVPFSNYCRPLRELGKKRCFINLRAAGTVQSLGLN